MSVAAVAICFLPASTAALGTRPPLHQDALCKTGEARPVRDSVGRAGRQAQRHQIAARPPCVAHHKPRGVRAPSGSRPPRRRAGQNGIGASPLATSRRLQSARACEWAAEHGRAAGHPVMARTGNAASPVSRRDASMTRSSTTTSQDVVAYQSVPVSCPGRISAARLWSGRFVAGPARRVNGDCDRKRGHHRQHHAGLGTFSHRSIVERSRSCGPCGMP